MVEDYDTFSKLESENHIMQKMDNSSSNHKTHDDDAENLAPSDSNNKKIEYPDLSEEPVLYTRRWFMVLLFAFYSASSSFQWIHLNIIGDKVLLFYQPSMSESPAEQAIAIDWLSMVYMLGYMLFMLPSSWLLDRHGLFVVGVMGTLLNCLGAWMKCAAIDPDRFALLMAGQCMCAVAQAFILGVPARLAAVWFGPNEVSTATAIGVFGNQIGCALGFLIPPMIVDNPPDCVPSNNSSSTANDSHSFGRFSLITTNHTMTTTATRPISCDDLEYLVFKLRILLYGTAIITTVLLILVILFFKKRPLSPPSRAQMVAQWQIASSHSEAGAAGSSSSGVGMQLYTASLYRLITYVPFLLLFFTYGINVGSYYAIGTLLNPIILHYFPTEHMKAGWIGLTLVLAGVLGSILSGVWLDRTKLFKSTTLVIYGLSCLGMLAFTLVLLTGNIEAVFATSFAMGFFMTGYLPVGFEYAAEITFPESEGTSSGLLNVSAQVFGILFTIISRALATVFMGNVFITLLLFVGTVATAFIKADLKRQRAHDRINNVCMIQSITTTSDPVL